jgi:hypothetical protein
MVIRAHMRGIAEVNFSPFPLRQSFDPWEFSPKKDKPAMPMGGGGGMGGMGGMDY